jgi:glycosyltransferase involved in cell wall biosynthesis
MRRIVLSGVNLVELGPSVVFKNALEAAIELFGVDYEIVALVHRKELVEVPGVRYIEFPDVKSSWLKRLRFEYYTLKSISRELDADLWLSMHDMTPNVTARRRAVYCHNPTPFYSLRVRDALKSWKFPAWVLLYGYLYRVNIRKNHFVIVQQDWLRREFERRYGLKNVVVAHPISKTESIRMEASDVRAKDQRFRFFYPAYPRLFKNHELILDAVHILEREGSFDYEVWVTFDAHTSPYARSLVTKYEHLRSVKWLGVLAHSAVLERYRYTDCLLFPSKLETWGLPIMEFKVTGRPMIVADLPYARETVGSYEQVAFVPVDSPSRLVELMRGAIRNEKVFARVEGSLIAPPFARNWHELWHLLLPECF